MLKFLHFLLELNEYWKNGQKVGGLGALSLRKASSFRVTKKCGALTTEVCWIFVKHMIIVGQLMCGTVGGLCFQASNLLFLKRFCFWLFCEWYIEAFAVLRNDFTLAISSFEDFPMFWLSWCFSDVPPYLNSLQAHKKKNRFHHSLTKVKLCSATRDKRHSHEVE